MEANQNITRENAGSGFKKKLLVALLAVAAVVVVSLSSVLATVAYLTSSAAVSNVFTIGSVGITMTESKVNPDGTLFDGGTTRVDTNTYHLVPNTTYSKDPTIFVTDGSEASYLFVLVRNDLEPIEDKSGTDGNKTIAQQLADNGWAKYTRASTGWVYIYVGSSDKVPAGDVERAVGGTYTYAGSDAAAIGVGSYPLFENFSIASDANVSTYGAAKITLTAVAIQKSGFATLADAWQAVVETYPYIHTGTGN